MTWFWIISIIVGLIGIAQVLAIAASQKASKILKKMETQYEDIVDVLLANAYLVGKTWDEEDQEAIIHKTMQMLKPHIDSLLANINATDTSDVKITFPTKYFANVATYADSLFYKRNKHKDTPLSHEDEEKMYATLRDALSADIMKRTLYLQAGKL